MDSEAVATPQGQSPAATEPGRTGIETALTRNRAFAGDRGHEDAAMFPSLRLLVVTCLDPRVDPAHLLGLDLGDAMVIRNGGGRVTPEVIDNVAFVATLAEGIAAEGPLFEVAVVHHTECGSRALADEQLRRRYAQRIGVDESTLVESAVVDPAATVAGDVGRLRLAAAISERVSVSGHVYDVATGLVETIVPATAAAGTSWSS